MASVALDSAGIAEKSVDLGGYTCPMHPEVRSAGPGSCPKCGMALEPLHVTAETADTPDPELASMTRRLWVGSGLTLPLLALMFAGQVGKTEGWIELALASPVVLWLGGRSSSAAGLRSSIAALTCFTLVAMGTGTSYLYSVAGGGCARSVSRRISRHVGEDWTSILRPQP